MRKSKITPVILSQRDADQIDDIAEHLYFSKATLAVLADLDPKQPDVFENGSVSHIALEAKIRLDKAIDLLNP